MRTPPGNLTSAITVKSMTGMSASTPLWKAGWTTWKKSGRGKKSSMTFSAASLQDLAKRKNCRWISTRGCSTGLWITQRSIRTAGWCSPSATVRKSARRFKESSSGQVPGTFGYPARCFCVWKFADKPFSIQLTHQQNRVIVDTSTIRRLT